MSKEEEMLKPFRESRPRKRKDHLNSHPSVVYFQVIGNGSPGGARSLFLFTDHNRYIFNCGEGTQRLFMEHCASKALGQMGNMFITSRTWDNLGGLLGMCLSMRAAGAPDVTIHGPAGCLDIYEATKSFIVMHQFDVMGHTEKDGIYEDSALTIRHVNIPSVGDPVIPEDPIYTFWRPDSSVPLTSTGAPVTKQSVKKVSKEAIDQTVTAFVINIKSKPGKLLIDKCLQLGVPPGPLLGELKAGRNVVLDDQTVVKASDVIDNSNENPGSFIVIECPTKGHLQPLLAEELLKADHPDLEHIQSIFHFTPHDVIESEEYLTWVNSFPPTTKHVVLNERSVGYGSRDVLVYNHRLNTICPDLFPNLLSSRKNDPTLYEPAKKYDKINGVVYQGKTGLKINVRTQEGEVEGDFQIEDIDEKILEKEILEIPEAETALQKLKDKIEVLKSESNDEPEYPVVTFLGTGSSVPSKYRCVSAILVETESNNFILLDCGEGTMLQLQRQFGREQTLHILRHLTAIYISHLHADHHMGLINIVHQRKKAFQQINENPSKLFILAPNRIAQYLMFYHQKFQPVLTDLYQVSNEHLLSYSPPSNKDLKTQVLYPNVLRELLEGTKLKSVVTSRAVHCPSSFCVSIVTAAGYKIVYTGDTRPNIALVELGQLDGKVPDLLIHEATMEHHMIKDCIAKKHSTFTQAAQEGHEMGAKFTMLTHFSQRYSKVPVFDEIEVEGMEDIGVAFDNMKITPATLKLIRPTFPAIKIIFQDSLEEMDLRRSNYGSRNFAKTIVASLKKVNDDDKSQSNVPKKKMKFGEQLNK